MPTRCPTQQVHTALPFIASAPHIDADNNLAAPYFVPSQFIVLIFRSRISLVHASTARLTSGTIFVRGHVWSNQIWLHVKLRTTEQSAKLEMRTQPGQQAPGKQHKQAPPANRSAPYKHPTGMCPSLIPKILGKSFSCRANKRELLMCSKQCSGLEGEQGAGRQQRGTSQQ